MFDPNELKDVRKGGFQILGLAFGWWLAIIMFVLVVGAIFWGLSVATAPIVGKGEQYKQINSSDNRTFQYQRFFDLDATIRTQSRNAEKARQELAEFNKQNPPRADESFTITEQRGQLRANATGLEQLCLDNINKYNNDAQEFTRNQFLDNKLPEHFNPGAAQDPSLLPPAAGGGH